MRNFIKFQAVIPSKIPVRCYFFKINYLSNNQHFLKDDCVHGRTHIEMIHIRRIFAEKIQFIFWAEVADKVQMIIFLLKSYKNLTLTVYFIYEIKLLKICRLKQNFHLISTQISTRRILLIIFKFKGMNNRF